MTQRARHQRVVASGKPAQQPVGDGDFRVRVATQRQRRHHGHVGKREDKGPQNGEGHGLGHRPEHAPLNAGQRQQGQVHNEDDDFPEGGRGADFARGLVGFLVHLLAREPARQPGPAAVQAVHNGLDDDDGSVHNKPEVNGPETHQVARDAEQAHQADGKEHGQRDDRGHHQPVPPVAQEEHQHEYDDERAFEQVLLDRVNGAAHQLRPVQVYVHCYPLWQRLADGGHALLDGSNHVVGVGPF